MRTPFLSILILFYTLPSVYAQVHAPAATVSYRIRIQDASSGKDISGASVFVNELRGPDQLSDNQGVVVFQIPTDRPCTVNIKKAGYKSPPFTIQASATSSYPNVKIVLLEKENTDEKIIYHGRVEDSKDQDIAGAEVILSYQGIPNITRTDSFGNYRFELSRSAFMAVRSYTIEVKAAGCESFKIVEDYTGDALINKNFKMKNCTGPTQVDSTPPPPPLRITDDIISGQWSGSTTMYNFPSYFKASLQITARQGKFKGTLRLTLASSENYFAVFNIEGNYTKDAISFTEIAVVDHGTGPVFCMKQYLTKLTLEGGLPTLSGNWNNNDHRFFNNGTIIAEPANNSCPGGIVTLTKVQPTASLP